MCQHQILQLMLMLYLRWRQLYDDSSHFGLMMLVVQLDLYLVWYSRATDGHCPFVAPAPPTSRAATPSASPWLPHAGTEQNWNVGTESFENVNKFKIQIRGNVTNKSKLHAQIKRRLNWEDFCCHSVQNLLSFHLIPKSVKIKMHINIILPF